MAHFRGFRQCFRRTDRRPARMAGLSKGDGMFGAPLKARSIGGGSVNSAPAADHHAGFARRSAACAASAAARSANSAKQVAPLPLMRASSAPGSRGQPVEHHGDLGNQASAASVRSLRRDASAAASPAASRGIGANRPRLRKRPAAARETPPAVGSASRGLASTMPAARQILGGLQHFADAADPDRPRREAGRHVGAEPRRQFRQLPRRRATAADRRRAARNAAAASLDPPPIPDAAGRRLSRCSAAPRARIAPASRRPRVEPGGAQHQIVVAEPGERPRLRAADGQRQPSAGERRRPGRRYRRRRPGCRAGDSRRPAARSHADRD